MSRIFWDSMLFIYWFENNPQYSDRVEEVFRRMAVRRDELVTSSLAVAETLVGVRRAGQAKIESDVLRFFRSPQATVVDFTLDAALDFADIRARYRIAAPDAIHLACAAQARTDVFITNDDDLVGKSIPGIQFIVRLNTAFF